MIADLQISVIDLQTHSFTALRPGSSPRWSPDGSRIVFVRSRTASEERVLATMAADGSNLRALLP